MGWLLVSSRWICALLAGSLAPHAAAAMQFDSAPAGPGTVLISGRGPIVSGDLGRLTHLIEALPAGQQAITLNVDSPGGNLGEAASISAFIRRKAVAVTVPSGGTCASACFLLLASAQLKSAAADAHIGVHSASESGTDTLAAKAITTEMARFAASLGVPPVILGKMVQTGPGGVAWLTADDLAAMGVTQYDGTAQAPFATGEPATPVPAADAAAAGNGWMTTESGCMVHAWEHTLDADAVRWSGGCAHGIGSGRGTMEVLRQGEVVFRYEGFLAAGERDGKASMRFADGSRYEGYWSRGFPQGPGRLILQDGSFLAGNWSKGCLVQGTRRAQVIRAAEECSD